MRFMKQFSLFFRDFPLLTTIQNGLFYLFAASIPFGTRTLIAVGNDPYQSVFLYFTDVLFVGFFLLWLAKDAKKIAHEKRILLLFAFLIGWFFLASIFSNDASLGFYRSLKMAEYGLVFLIFFTHSFSPLSKRNVFTAILVSAVIQSILAIGQFVFQSSFGLWWLGEQTLAPSLAGVAKIEVFGEKIIRAYGTFPHPNVLAAFLVLALFISVASFGRPYKKHDVFRIICILVLTIGLLLTFSRVVTILGLLGLCIAFFLQKEREPLAVFLLSIGIFGIVLSPYLFSRFSVNLQEQAVSLRVSYAKNAFNAIAANPFFGVGPGQFTAYQEQIINESKLPEWMNQPVHNIYLLLASEAGVPALVFFCWFLFVLLMRSKKEFVILVSAFLILGFFDHFFLTYQQGALMFWLTLGLTSGKVKLN